ncbi:hypothetical protein JYT59_00395 [Sphingobacteriaceae bacterium AH-315-L07]|nr:hypothetical protein [Sphingobacteriaceae bacterium AH-315-L07]
MRIYLDKFNLYVYLKICSLIFALSGLLSGIFISISMLFFDTLAISGFATPITGVNGAVLSLVLLPVLYGIVGLLSGILTYYPFKFVLFRLKIVQLREQ